MFSAWTVGIRMIATSNFGLIASGISREAARAEKSVGGLKRQVNTIGAGGTGKAAAGMNAINAGATRAESRVAALKGTMAVADRSMQAFGLVSAATFGIGIKGAADLQDAMAQTAIAMGRSTSYVESNFTGIATAMSMRTAQSVAQSMGILRTMATSGLNDPKELKSLAMPIAMYADTQYLLKGTDFNQSAAIATKVAHGFGARTSGELAPILNSLFKISNDMPDSMSAMATQLKYYAPKFVEKGVSANEVLMLQATADRMGYGTGKSGTGFYQIYRNVLDPSTRAMGRAQHALGIDGNAVIGKDGKFDPEKLFNRLATVRRQYEYRGDAKQFDIMLKRAFTSNAALIAGVMSSEAGRKQYENVKQTMHRVKDMEPAQAQAMATLSKQTILLISNFKTLATFIAQPWIKPFTDAIGSAAKAVGNLAIYMKDHQTVAKVTGGVMMGAAAYFAVRMAMAGRKFYDFFATLGKHPHAGVVVGKSLGWGRKAATVATEGASVIAKRSILGRVAVGTAGLFGLGGGMKAIGGIQPFISSFAKVGELFASFGLKTLTTRGGLMLLAEVIGKIGLRAIPVVGEVLMLIDVVKFLGTHAKDIGKGIGIAAKWIVAHGVPMIVEAFKSIIFGLWDLIKNLAGYMKDSYVGLFRGIVTGNFHGGISDTLKNLGSGIKQGWNAEDNDKRYNEQHRIDADRKKAAPLGTNPALHGPKLTMAVLPVAQMKAAPPNAALPSANPFTLSPNLTQPALRAERPRRERTRAVSHPVNASVHAPKTAPLAHRREQTREVAHPAPLVVNFNVTVPHGNQADVERALRNQHRALADAVAEAHARTLRTSGRAAGQAPAMAGASGFEFAGAPG